MSEMPEHSRLWWWWCSNFRPKKFWEEWGKCMDVLAATSRAIAENFPDEDPQHQRLDTLAEYIEAYIEAHDQRTIA